MGDVVCGEGARVFVLCISVIITHNEKRNS